MHKRIWLLALLSILLFAGTANAITQIVLGGGDNLNNVQFAGTGSGATMSFLGSCGSNSNCTTGTAYFDANVGSFQMWVTGSNPTVVGTTLSLSSYPVGMTGSTVNFLFSMGSGATLQTLQGTLSYITLGNAGGQTPSLNGTFTTSAVTPGGTLASFWGMGTTSAAVFTLDMGANPSVNSIVGTANSTKGTPYSGDVPAPGVSTVPEPATIAMLGSGLLALGGTIKRRLFR
jgi:hypothetical protein